MSVSSSLYLLKTSTTTPPHTAFTQLFSTTALPELGQCYLMPQCLHKLIPMPEMKQARPHPFFSLLLTVLSHLERPRGWAPSSAPPAWFTHPLAQCSNNHPGIPPSQHSPNCAITIFIFSSPPDIWLMRMTLFSFASLPYKRHLIITESLNNTS